MKLLVGLAQGLKTTQRSGDLCLVIMYDIVHQRECQQIHFLQLGYFI
jgi:hypothetical protein